MKHTFGALSRFAYEVLLRNMKATAVAKVCFASLIRKANLLHVGNADASCFALQNISLKTVGVIYAQ